MARDDAPPFARGETWYNGGAIDPTSNATLGGVNLEGKEYVFEPNSQNAGQATPISQEDTGRAVRVRVVRNISGVNLKGARIARYSAINPFRTRVDGYTFALGDVPAGIIDEFLPAAGVPNNDLFYLVVSGPSKVTQPNTGNSSLAIGDRLVPTAGGGTSATDDLSGRVLKQDLTGATATLGNNIQNRIGYAGEINNAVNAKIAVVVHLVQ